MLDLPSAVSTITSRRHQIVRRVRELADHPPADGHRVLLDGPHLVRAGLDAGLAFEVAAVAGAAPSRDELTGLADALRDAGAEVVDVSASVLDAMSPVRTPSGIVAVVRRPPITPSDVVATAGLVLVLVGVQDPGNVGSLLRSAEASGAAGALVCEGSANPFAWKAVRGSMGSVLRLPTAYGPPASEALVVLRQASFRAIGTAPRGGGDPDEVDWTGRVALLLGGEGAGLAAPLTSACDALVTIPMARHTESLSVSAAGAVLLYAARRQRR